MYSAPDTTKSSGGEISGESSPTAEGESGDGENKGARPIGTKLAKLQKKRKQEPNDKLDKCMESMSNAMHERNSARKRRDAGKISLKKQKLAFEIFNKLVGPASGANETERDSAAELMRKAFMNDLLNEVGESGIAET